MLLTIVIIGLLSGLLLAIYIFTSISQHMKYAMQEVVNVRFDLQQKIKKE